MTKKKANPDEQKIKDVEAFYGIEFTGDKDKFIEDATAASKTRASQKQQEDPREDGRYTDIVGTLRRKWDAEKKITPEQKSLAQELEEEYPGVGIVFPDDKTWTVSVSGKEDSGHMSAGTQGVFAVAKKLTSRPE